MGHGTFYDYNGLSHAREDKLDGRSQDGVHMHTSRVWTWFGLCIARRLSEQRIRDGGYVINNWMWLWLATVSSEISDSNVLIVKGKDCFFDLGLLFDP